MKLEKKRNKEICPWRFWTQFKLFANKQNKNRWIQNRSIYRKKKSRVGLKQTLKVALEHCNLDPFQKQNKDKRNKYANLNEIKPTRAQQRENWKSTRCSSDRWNSTSSAEWWTPKNVSDPLNEKNKENEHLKRTSFNVHVHKGNSKMSCAKTILICSNAAQNAANTSLTWKITSWLVSLFDS